VKKAVIIPMVVALLVVVPLGFACDSDSNQGPKAAFTAEPTSGSAPLQVEFTDQSVGEITEWAWDFDNDGTVDSTERNPSQIYDASGEYTVSLRVAGPVGSDEELKAQYIEVEREPMTVEEAMEMIRQFEGDSLPDLEFLAFTPEPAADLAIFECSKAAYHVDLDTGMIAIALYQTSRSSEVQLSMDEAQSIAAEFAPRAHADFSALTILERELLDHGSGGKEYSFIWKRIVDGAIVVFSFVQVSINPGTGEVMGFVSKDIEVEPFDPPVIGKSEAEIIARVAFTEETGKGVLVGEPVLEVTFPIDEATHLPGQEQHLVWSVEVEEVSEPGDFCNGAIFSIDAHTGEILYIAGFGC